MRRLRGPWSLSTRPTLLVAILAVPVLLIITFAIRLPLATAPAALTAAN